MPKDSPGQRFSILNCFAYKSNPKRIDGLRQLRYHRRSFIIEPGLQSFLGLARSDQPQQAHRRHRFPFILECFRDKGQGSVSHGRQSFDGIAAKGREQRFREGLDVCPDVLGGRMGDSLGP